MIGEPFRLHLVAQKPGQAGEVGADESLLTAPPDASRRGQTVLEKTRRRLFVSASWER